MRNLIIILLVSILGCGLVLKRQDYPSVEAMSKMMTQASELTESIISDIFFDMQTVVVKFPQATYRLDLMNKMESYIKNKSDSLTIPKSEIELNSLIYNWKKNLEAYFEIVEDEKKREDLIYECSPEMNNLFYHQDANFRNLLYQIHLKQIESTRYAVAKNLYISGDMITCMCFDYLSVATRKAIQLNKISTLPIVFTHHCDNDRGLIHKIWINNELVYDIKKDISKFFYDKVRLRYNGEQATNVKVAVQKYRKAPIVYEEMTFDFNLHTCDKID